MPYDRSAPWIKAIMIPMLDAALHGDYEKAHDAAFIILDHPDARLSDRQGAYSTLAWTESDPELAVKYTKKSFALFDELLSAQILEGSASASDFAARQAAKMFVEDSERILDVQRKSEKVLSMAEKHKLRRPIRVAQS